MIQILPITGLPEFKTGDPWPQMLVAHLQGDLRLQPGDVLVVTQKIVSKAEGRFITLSGITPSPEAIALAAEVNKDASLVELVLRESCAVVRKAPNILITRHRLGHVMANAGIDASNIGAGNSDKVLLYRKTLTPAPQQSPWPVKAQSVFGQLLSFQTVSGGHGGWAQSMSRLAWLACLPCWINAVNRIGTGGSCR